MIVYKLTCLKTGLSYVGSTVGLLLKRWKKHWADGKRGHSGALYEAMREHTSPWDWERCVLSEHLDVLSMVQAESDSILSHRTLKPNGYNDKLPDVEREAADRVALVARVERLRSIHVALGKRGDTLEARDAGSKGAEFGVMGAKQPTREEMTSEQLEAAREHGRRGAAARSKEELAEAGRKGAAAVWADPSHKGKVAKAAREGHKRWWDSLTEEQKEEHREKGRRANRKGVSP